MRPRGESISSPHSRYVGHVGRQNPQCTHLSMSAGDGASAPANAGVAVTGSVGMGQGQGTWGSKAGPGIRVPVSGMAGWGRAPDLATREHRSLHRLDRATTGIENARRIEHLLERADGAGALEWRPPDVHGALDVGGRAQHHDMT